MEHSRSMANAIIKIKRGDVVDTLPILEDGELAYVVSKNQLWIGTPYGNALVNSNSSSDKPRGLTNDGGSYNTFTSDLGVVSKKGMIVGVSTTLDSGVRLNPASSGKSIGIVYDSDINHGNTLKVTTEGIAYVLLKDNTSCNRGDWVGMSDVEGRAIAKQDPASQTERFTQIGYALETVNAGLDKLVKVVLHFN